MRFRLEIDCDDDALASAPLTGVAQILRTAANRLLDRVGCDDAEPTQIQCDTTLRDVNGNTVGAFSFDDGEGR